MKKYIKSLFFAGILLAGCMPDTEELRVIRTEELKKPDITPPTVDLTKVVVLFAEKEQSLELYRDPENKLVAEKVFSFIPKFTKRNLEEGESIKLRLVAKHNNSYQLFLPQETYSVEKGEVASGTDGAFAVKLKADAFKDVTKYQNDKEYVLSFGIEVAESIPNDLPILGVEEAIYQIKIKLTDFKFPEGDNVEVAESIDGAKLTNFEFSSNYATSHLYKLTDGRSWTNWWVDTNNQNIFLKATFSEATLVKGVKFDTWNGSGKFLGGVSISVLPSKGEQTFYQGTYVHTNNSTGEVILKFVEPIDVKEIKLYDFKKGGNQYIDIYEIEFY